MIIVRIGELSKLTAVSVRSLRYYERQGLLMPYRTENGYREYSPLAVEQVQTIAFYLKLGLTTEEIGGFLHCVLQNKEAFCRQVVPVYRKKLAELEKQIELLTMIKSNLEERVRLVTAENPALLEE
jgi:DNA-binding transcriptional MerR regulator